jgi:hypothetical protein
LRHRGGKQFRSAAQPERFVSGAIIVIPDDFADRPRLGRGETAAALLGKGPLRQVPRIGFDIKVGLTIPA